MDVIQRFAAKVGNLWMRSTVASKGVIPLVLGGALVAGVALATNEEFVAALRDSTVLDIAGSTTVTASTLAMSADTPEPAVSADPAYPDKPQWFVRGADNKLWLRRWNGTQWIWESMQGTGGPYAYSAPAVAGSNGERFVFVKGADNALWYRRQATPTATWGSWQSLGGYLTSGPAATIYYTNIGSNLVVIVRGGDNKFYYRVWASRYPNYTRFWTEWTTDPRGRTFSSGPAVAQFMSPVHVFGRGMNNEIYERKLHDNGEQLTWSDADWNSLGGVLTSGPSAATYSTPPVTLFGQLTMVVMARGSDGAMWVRTFCATFCSGSWSSWHSLGGVFTSGGTVFPTVDAYWAYGRGTDGKMYYTRVTVPEPAILWTPVP